MSNINPNLINPSYVQINKKEAAGILRISERELDQRRKSDERCPDGFKERNDRVAPVRFRLSDIYAYSEAIMNDAVSAISSPDDPMHHYRQPSITQAHKG